MPQPVFTLPAPSEEEVRDSLCDGFWKEPTDSVVRVYACALAQSVHAALEEWSPSLNLSATDLEDSGKLLKALLDGDETLLRHLLQPGNTSPDLHRFIICIMRRLANIHSKTDLPDRQKYPDTGHYHDSDSYPDILATTFFFFPEGESVFFSRVMEKREHDKKEQVRKEKEVRDSFL